MLKKQQSFLLWKNIRGQPADLSAVATSLLRLPRLTYLSSWVVPFWRDSMADFYLLLQQLEKKRQDYERLREQRRRFEAEMQKLDAQTRLEAQELQQMTEDIAKRLGAGHQSEPTTPPEYREVNTSLSTIWSTSRPNRYSTSSLTSPPGLYNRPNRSGSLLTSPQSGGGAIPARYAFDDPLSHSVPGSRRNSDEDDEKEEAVRQDPTSHRSTNQ